MAIKVFRSTDVDAPVLTGTAGQMTVVLDACLVNGYGTGVDEKTAVGWTKEFTDTNRSAYKMPAGSTGHYLYVDDNGSGTSEKYAKVRAYESMTNIDTGSNPFPTTSQRSNGLYWYKSDGNNTNPRPWVVVASEKFFFFFAEWHDSYSNQGEVYTFGEYPSFKAGDAFNTLLTGGISTSPSYPGDNNSFSQLVNDEITDHYGARAFNQLGSSINLGKYGDKDQASNGHIGSAGMAYPHPIDNGLHVSQVVIVEEVSGFAVTRGIFPGLYQPLHKTPLTIGDQVQNIVGLPGRTLEYFRIGTFSSASTDASFMLDLTGDWE